MVIILQFKFLPLFFLWLVSISSIKYVSEVHMWVKHMQRELLELLTLID